MKTCEEKARSALERIREQKKIRKRRKQAAVRILTPLLCLCLALLAGAGVWRGPDPQEQGTGQTSAASIADPVSSGDSSVSDGAYAVYTDKLVLPDTQDSVMADMIGCLVYRGKVYVQGESYTGRELEKAEGLVGEYLGEAKGSLSEWSKQEEWATEFASTYSGSVYTVKGYDADFRLCVFEDRGGTPWLQLLENFDGIGLNDGSDLFEKRLHIRENVEQVTFLPHDEWNNGDAVSRRALDGISGDQWDAFVDALCSAPVKRISYEEHPDFYDAAVQGHVYVEKQDGTQIELRLLEGGYVGYQRLGWIFVEMPGDLFDAVLSACQ